MNDVSQEYLYCMFKGEPGTRKSTQALSFPRPQYWFSWDRKMSALKIPIQKWGILNKDIHYDDYDDWTRGRKKLEEFRINFPYKTLIVDSVTSCADMTLRQTLQMKGGVTRQSGQSAGKLIAGIPVNEMEDYNAESSALNELIALTKDIHRYHRVNVVLIAHVMEVTQSQKIGESVRSRSIVTAGKRAAAKLPAYCDEVYHFDIDVSPVEGAGGQYRVTTEHTGDDFARTTLPLPRKILFGNEPLYDKWLRPAIEQLKPQPITKG
jgi:hypothetical protein